MITVEELRAQCGREVGVGPWFTVTQRLIDDFAALSGDTQWIHVDVERARAESPFGSTVAHGFLTLTLLSRLVREAGEIAGDFKLRVNYGFNRLRFPAPVPAGARIRARVTPNLITDVEGSVLVTWGVLVEIEDQPKPALAAEWLVRLYQ